MGETITVCESICRDFSWFWSLDPSIIQGLLTVAAAAIGAGVALYIAKKVYPIQKEKDREIKIDEEKRQVYRDYLRSIDLVINSRLYDGTTDKVDVLLGCKSALNEVHLFSSEKTAHSMWELFQAATSLSSELSYGPTYGKVESKKILELRETTNHNFNAAINAARQELGEQNLKFSPDISILSATRSYEDK